MNIKFSIQKKLGHFSLDVEAEFQEGLIGIFGESGAGKTTLLNCLTGVLKPDIGEICIGDKICFSSQKQINTPIEHRDVGMVFQDALLFPHMTVKRNIFYGRRRDCKKSYVEEVLALLNLYKFLDRKPESLSGGERQRVAFARTLIHQPSVLLMDEPISSLDEKARLQIITYTKKIHQSLKIPIIYVSHSVSELLFLVERVYVINKGRTVADGHPFETILADGVISKTIEEELENIYDLPVLEFRQPDGLVMLDLGGFPLSVAYHSPHIHPRIRVGIKARDIIAATTEIKDISARNVMQATIERIIQLENSVILHTNIYGKACLVEITQPAYHQLGLELHKTVYLIIKASSVKILD